MLRFSAISIAKIEIDSDISFHSMFHSDQFFFISVHIRPTAAIK